MSNFIAYAAYARKAIIQFLTLVVTFATAILTFNLLPDKYASTITVVVGLAGSLLHFMTANAPKPGEAPAVVPFDPTADETDDGDGVDPSLLEPEPSAEPDTFLEPGTFPVSTVVPDPQPDNHVPNAELSQAVTNPPTVTPPAAPTTPTQN